MQSNRTHFGGVVQETHERVEITADIHDDETTANSVSSYTSTIQRVLAEEAEPVPSRWMVV
jgi:hypothetical protein